MERHTLIDENSEFDAVILAAGDFPRGTAAKGILTKTRPLIVCDSALEEIVEYNSHQTEEHQLTPAAVVGDGDSLSPTLMERYHAIWRPYQRAGIQRPHQGNALCHRELPSEDRRLRRGYRQARGPHAGKHLSDGVLSP